MLILSYHNQVIPGHVIICTFGIHPHQTCYKFSVFFSVRDDIIMITIEMSYYYRSDEFELCFLTGLRRIISCALFAHNFPCLPSTLLNCVRYVRACVAANEYVCGTVNGLLINLLECALISF